MPELRRWFRFLAARLRHVRILNGDWSRLTTTGALQTLPVRTAGGYAGVFLDPPYDPGERDVGLYGVAEDNALTAKVRQWCRANGTNPRYRIILAGFDTEHVELESEGWRVVEWFTEGFLRGGMGTKEHQQHRERLWLSPHCLDAPHQLGLFAAADSSA